MAGGGEGCVGGSSSSESSRMSDRGLGLRRDRVGGGRLETRGSGVSVRVEEGRVGCAAGVLEWDAVARGEVEAGWGG